jgi:hypothetical protein
VSLAQRERQVAHDGREPAAADAGGDLRPVAVAQRRPVHVESLEGGEPLIDRPPERVEHLQLALGGRVREVSPGGIDRGPPVLRGRLRERGRGRYRGQPDRRGQHERGRKHAPAGTAE